MPTQSRKKGNAGATRSPRQTGAQRAGGKPDELERYRPHTHERSLGYARKRDIEDSASQQSAPRGPGHYDRTGEDEYAEGLEEFEDEGGAIEPTDKPAASSSKPNWELDEGGVQFGGKRRRGSETDADQPRDANANPSRTQRTR